MTKEMKKVFVSNKGRVYSLSEMSDSQEKKWKKQIEERFRVARDTLKDITIHKSNNEWENLTPINKRRFIASEVNTQIFNWLGIATSEEMEHMKTKIRQQALEIDSLKVANKTNNPYLESDRMKQILLLALNELDKEVANWTLIKAILNQARDEL